MASASSSIPFGASHPHTSSGLSNTHSHARVPLAHVCDADEEPRARVPAYDAHPHKINIPPSIAKLCLCLSVFVCVFTVFTVHTYCVFRGDIAVWLVSTAHNNTHHNILAAYAHRLLAVSRIYLKRRA